MHDERIVVFVATAWGPAHGGVNSFNYDLCIALAREINCAVYCIVSEASDDEKAEALNHRVTLLPLDHKIGDGHFPSTLAGEIVTKIAGASNREVALWIGHDTITGISVLDARRISQQGQSVVINHVDYEAYESFKEGDGERAFEKHKAQVDMLCRADLVCAVGPKLARAARSCLSEAKTTRDELQVIELIPGLQNISDSAPPENFKTVTFGRLNSRTDSIKQGRLAVAAFGRAVKDFGAWIGADPRITIFGISATDPAAEGKQLQAIAADYAGRLVTVNAVPYVTNREDLFAALRAHSVALFLSLHEGFGLAAWEAIAAGLPVVISKNTGVFELINERLGGPGTGCLLPVSIKGSANPAVPLDEDIRNVAEAIGLVARNPLRARRDAIELRRMLRRQYNWHRTARHFADACALPLYSQHVNICLAGGFADPAIFGHSSTPAESYTKPQRHARQVWIEVSNYVGKFFADFSSPGFRLRFPGVDGGCFAASVVRKIVASTEKQDMITTIFHKDFTSEEEFLVRNRRDYPDHFTRDNVDPSKPYTLIMGDLQLVGTVDQRRALLVQGADLVFAVSGTFAVNAMIDVAFASDLPVLAIGAFGGTTKKRLEEIRDHNRSLGISDTFNQALDAVAQAPLDSSRINQAAEAALIEAWHFLGRKKDEC